MDVAVERVGGLTKAANLLSTSPQTINEARHKGRMPTNTPEAMNRIAILAEASGVSRLDLVGLGASFRPSDPDGTRIAREALTRSSGCYHVVRRPARERRPAGTRAAA